MRVFLQLVLLEVAKRRNAIIGWGIGLAAYAMMIMAIAPSLAEQFSKLDLSSIPIYQAFGITSNIDSAASLLAVYLPFFGLALAVYGAITGSNALAGEEDNGTLEMQLSLPLRRHTLVLTKAIGILVALFLISLFTFVGYAVFYPSVSASLDTNLKLIDFFNASWEMVPISAMFAMLAMLIGTIMPNRGVTLGITIALLIAAYLLNNMAGSVDVLKDAQPLSPFYYYNGATVLDGVIDWRRVVTLEIVGAVFLLLAVLFFRKRNVTVGLWPWQRMRSAGSIFVD